jgi:tripartite-type tricarboxylate transporter receptor subunit TctC
VPFPPGGVTDVLARAVGAKLGERLGQAVVVENRPGGGAIVGTAAVAKAEPDGYTLLMSAASHATFSSLYDKLPFDPVKDFAPISLIASIPYLMVVHPSLPVTSVSELIAHAGANPGKISYAGSAPGLAQHLGWERFKRMVGVDMVYVPYKGSAAQMPDLLAGRVPAAIDSVLIMQPHLKIGALRAIAVTTAKRSPLLPELPTVAETIPDFQATGWFGLFAPAGTPAAIVNRINKEVGAIVKEKTLREQMAGQGVETLSGSPDDLRRWLAQEVDLWSKVIRDANIKIN